MPCCAEKDTGFCRPAPSTRRPEDIPDPNGTKRLDACPTAAGGCPMRRIVAGLQCGVSAPSVPLRRSEMAAYGRTCPASFRHSVTEKCHSAARPLADPASGSLASHPFTALRRPGILQQMIDIAFDLSHLGQQCGAGCLLQFQ